MRSNQHGDVGAERTGHEGGRRRVAGIEDRHRVRDVIVEPIAVGWVVACAGTPRVIGKDPKAITETLNLVTQDPASPRSSRSE